MSAIWAVARAEIRASMFQLALLGVLAGLAGAVVGSALAVAGRTDTAYARLERATKGDDARGVVLGPDQRTSAELAARIARLPQVRESRTAPFAVGRLVDDQVVYVALIGGAQPGGVLDPVIAHGRLPRADAPDEVVMLEAAARDFHVRPGAVIPLRFLLRDEFYAFSANKPLVARGPRIDLRVVGTVRIPGRNESFPPVISGRAFVDAHPDAFAAGVAQLVRLRNGDRDFGAFVEGADRLAADVQLPSNATSPPVGFESTAAARSELTATTRIEVTGLFVAALIAAITGVVALVQAAARHHVGTVPDQEVLAALGMPRTSRAAGRAVTALVPASIAGALVLIGTGVAGLAEPLGGTHPFEPRPGWAPNLAVMVLSAVATGVLTVAVLVGFVLTRDRAVRVATRRDPMPARRAAAFGGRPSIVTALRYAFGRGPGSVRFSIVATVVAVLGLSGVLIFAASLDRLRTTPRRYGWPAELRVEDATPEVIDALTRDPRVATVLDGVTTEVDLDGHGAIAGSWEARKGELRWAMEDGRLPARPDEVALGSKLAADLDKFTGDAVVARREGKPPVRLTIVGVGVIPGFDSNTFGNEAAFTRRGLESVATADPLSHAGFSAAPGTPIARLAGEYSDRYELTAVTLPAGVANLVQLRGLLRGLEIFLAAFAALALMHAATATARRRRRELAVLGALGLRPRQRAAVLIAMTAAVALVATAVAVPLGLAAGSAVWRVVADDAGVAGDALFSKATIGLAVAAVLAGALVVSAQPAWRAARLRLGENLRVE